VTLVVPTAPGTVGPFTASSNAITIAQNADVNLTLVISGSDLALSCTAYPDDSAPTGITSFVPDASPVSPVIVTAGPVTPPPTVPPGQPGAFELFCPGTPVGNIALNNVSTTASIPSGLSTGQQFEATNFQTNLNLPSSIVSAAAALGNSAITGDAVVRVDATGASPATVSSGDLAINVPIPSPVPASGLAFALPSPPGSVGPFTATGGDITLTIDPAITLTLVVSGSDLNLTCKPYPNNSEPTGIVATAPNTSPVAPVIATGSAGTTPGTTPSTTPTSAPATTVPDTGTVPATTSVPATTVPDTGTAPSTTQVATAPVAATDSTTSAPAPGSTTTARSGSSTTAAAATGAKSSTADTGAPTTAPDPVVSASSGALAFTGVGVIAQWLAVVGGALMILGFVLLLMVDTPRRLRFRLAQYQPPWRRTTP
jgi:hypothetical protein